MLVGFAFIEDTAILAILLLGTLATLPTLGKSRHLMSMRARYMQSHINRLMFADVSQVGETSKHNRDT